MFSRTTRATNLVLAIVASMVLVGLANGREGYWQGDVSTDWNTAGNWYVVGADSLPGNGFVPQASGGFNVRAIMGTDSVNGTLNTTTGNAPVISAALPATKATIGGLYFGLRELDYTFNPPLLVNPEPGPGELVGSLTITGGTLNNISTGDASTGADGRIVVGEDGRGFLTMTGGTLTGQALVVGGEEYTEDALGTSLVDLSGSALLSVTNSNPINGTATLDRRLKITGPSAHLTTNGTVTFGSTSTFDAVITSAADPVADAMIQSGSALRLNGELNVEFSGAGATGHTVGDKWNIATATTGVAGSFSNLGVGKEITPTGLPAEVPTGSAYYLRTVDGGNGKLVQVSYEGVLVLHVNRDTGELSITNPLGGQIAIDSYQVRSANGSMLPGYAGLGTTTPGAGDWTKPQAPGTNSVNGLYEVKVPDMTEPIENDDAYDLSSVASVSLGTGFSRTGVAADSAKFGQDGEDLVFSYSSPFGGVTQGQIVYEGTKFENDLVLRVNPNTGEATLKNDSLETLKLDGYAILSDTGALSGTSWTGLGAGWDQSPASSTSLTESNLLGVTELAPGAEMAIGDISASGFSSDAAQEGLSLQFILAEGFESGAAGGDYNEDGTVNIADYTLWRNNLGASITLPNENPAATTPGVVDAEDYDFWKAQFGSTGGAVPETEFRMGSIVFDTSLAAASAALASQSVPEPGTALLVGLGVAVLSLARRNRLGVNSRNYLRAVGGSTMSNPMQLSLMAAALLAALLVMQPATAQTQGIPLTNGDFELPGPEGEKTIAFDSAGVPLNNIPGWTFPGPGVEDFGHEDHENGDALGDSGTEGGGNPGNEMILSTFDGVAYQTSTFNAVSIPSTQKYRLSFDAQNIYTVLADGAPDFEETQNQLTVRLYYLEANGTTRTTIGSPLVISGLDARADYSIEFVGGSAELTPALGRPLGVEFDTTSDLFNPTWVEHSWAGVDNVLLQIAGVMAGDLDGDGDVDLVDYGIVRDNQQQSQLFISEGELTGDAFVDLEDFRAFKTAYETQNGAGSLAIALQAARVPEPSTMVLVMLLGAVVTCVKCRRFSTLRIRLASLAAISLATAATPASAELLFYDPFLIGTNPAAGEYVAGSPLAGQNPVAPYGSMPDLLTGAWVQTAPQGQVKAAPGLNFIGAPAEGGSVGTVENPETFVIDTRVGRYFKAGSEWTDATVGTYYISWMQNFGTITNATDDMGFRAFEIWQDPSQAIGDPNLLMDIGYNAYYHPNNPAQRQAATARLEAIGGIADGSIIDNSPANFMEDGATHLIVMKFVLSDQADSDTISIYLDPTSVTEPDLPDLAYVDIDVNVAALGFGQFGGFGPTYNTVDEIRIADAFIDALPELPLPGDTDGDRDVDLDDYNNIITHMGLQVGTALEGDVARADGTQGSDGRVTIADYRIWKDNYPTTASGAAALAGGEVPEPAAWLLMLSAAAIVAGSRCRRS